ncbi:20S PROTEASOME ALPHA-TYPE SUBUNIT [Encephalitozoon cuniculi GB-M1]|uniref:Probable proteasome subunit beta type-6 n=1 Tax=Encephalitozoon cuniculi (strain GB-M1) TaxID=284813 RepID=PSB6_ENCCU|nr:uncharacterized protein ECU07_1420 [Encephalitozoon cuniculi GB-M1]Q8SRH6.1 RecName: Full=Probable proteasome subunit beta type-6; AltName: Full=26S proteasome beta-type subunit PRE7; AltName: Full=Multicatalytic endopeptidase complex subunit PRE7 [Encephalitozoon cuniculi GB-M1]CAD25674.1 20S PROTEASOME ALPHA-TYPE SUBUNIT [Encephalitozoon cuniculi GB-M1]
MLSNKRGIHSASGGIDLRTLREYCLFEDFDVCMPFNPMGVPGGKGNRGSDGAIRGMLPLGDAMGDLFTAGKAGSTKMEDKERFDPYEDNSGTTICLKQGDFIVVAGDTRHSSSMVINSREMSKIFQVGDFLLTGTGFYADTHEVYVKMVYEIRQYEVDDSINIHSAANLLSKILYSKRFFPYYSFCVLSGFEKGKPYVYSYDPIGSFGSVTCVCSGSGRSMIQPLLDSFIDKKNWNNAEETQLSQEDCIRLVVKAFNSAAERDVKTKDNLEVCVMRENQVMRETFPLRRD